MLSRGSWIRLPASLTSLLTDVDGRGTDLGVFLAAADLLVLRDGAALVLVLPTEHSWPSEGDRQEALRRGDRLSLTRLQLVARANCLNWELPVSYGLPGRIVWREPVDRPASSEPAYPGAAVAEQINALLGVADGPDRWHCRSLSLFTAGKSVTGLQLAHDPVCADPQTTSGWRNDEPVATTAALAQPPAPLSPPWRWRQGRDPGSPASPRRSGHLHPQRRARPTLILQLTAVQQHLLLQQGVSSSP